jgi:tetratricopeptide (TPR) repeat protein
MSAELQILGGVVAVKSGAFEEAVARFRAVEPGNAEAMLGLMMALKALGRFGECREVALGLGPNPLVLNALGWAEYHLGNLESALTAFDHALRLNPRESAIQKQRGMTLVGLQRDTEARLAFEAYLADRPGDEAVSVRLSSLHLQHDRPEEALRYAVGADPEAAFIRARALSSLGRTDEAERVFREQPLLGAPFGVWLIEQGRLEEAEDVLAGVLQTEPDHGMARYYLLELRRQPMSADDAERLQRIAEDEDDVPESRVYASYALGKAWERAGEFEASFHAYERANSIMFGRKFRNRHDLVSTIETEVDVAIQRFTPERLASLSASGDPSERPIFIVGMIRSGTTLLEQIISSHLAVHGAGELRYWMENGPTAVNHLDRIPAIAAGYRQVLDAKGRTAPRVTDKMPLNLRFLGLIHACFPNAKFVHIQRDPMDTCFSIYTTPFTDPPLFSYDLGNIGTVYRHYARLMAHWEAVIPSDRLLTVRYEDLVTEQEAETRRILAFLGLKWEEACLSPERNRSAVLTPSTLQVRQAVNRNAVGRWKPYEAWLGSLIECLRL